MSSVLDTLPDAIKANLLEMGIHTPTPIQQQSIAVAIEGRDVLAQSHTGSGKTLAFAIPVGLKILQEKSAKHPRALVLTPTRELAQQVATVFQKTFQRTTVRSAIVMGGASYRDQKFALERADVVIGTPGRIVDLIERGTLKLDTIEMFVLDEVDQMLDIGFADALEAIRSKLPPKHQTLFFSATLQSKIRRLATSMLQNPKEIKTAGGDQHPAGIEHGFAEVKPGTEIKALVNLLLFHRPTQALIFCETKLECSQVAEALTKRGFDASPINSDMSQSERTMTMEKFRKQKLRYLVATDVAARGIDVPDMPLVINLHVPHNPESYTHRSGRTGRAGATGRAWTFVSPRKRFAFRNMMRDTKVTPNPIEIPGPSVIYKQFIDAEMQKLLTPVDAGKGIEKVVNEFIEELSDSDKTKALRNALVTSLQRLAVFHVDEIVAGKMEERPQQRPRSFQPHARDKDRPSGGKPSYGKDKPSFGKGFGKKDRFRKEDGFTKKKRAAKMS